jgi:ABC-type nitrate/sulfonate/bicarbonate transport system substrate-binding protein
MMSPRPRRMNQRLLRLAVGILAVVALVPACASSASPAGSAPEGPQTVRMAAPTSLNSLGAHVAETAGNFAESGLQVEFVNATSGAQIVPMLLGQQVEFSVMDMVTAVAAASKNIPLVIIAPAAVDSPPQNGIGNATLAVTPDSQISSVADLAGKSMGISQLNGLPWLQIVNLLENVGVDPASVQFVEVEGPRAIAALQQGQVDGVWVSEPRMTEAILEGRARSLAPTGGGEPGVPTYAYVTSRAFAEGNPLLVDAFVHSVFAAHAAVNSDRGLAVDVAAAYTGVPASLLSQAYLPTFGTGPVTGADLQGLIQNMVTHGIVEESASPDPATLLWSSSK